MNPDPAPAPPRRFTLIDGMALIAAFAVCCSVPRLFEWSLPPSDQIGRIMLVGRRSARFWVCWAMVLSATLAFLEAFGPRPAGSRRSGRPGGLAMLMVAACWAYAAAQNAAWDLEFYIQGGDFNNMFRMHWIFRPIFAASNWNGLAILASWATLAWVGAWEPTRDWLDRSGRVLGALWVLYGLAGWLAERLDSPFH